MRASAVERGRDKRARLRLTQRPALREDARIAAALDRGAHALDGGERRECRTRSAISRALPQHAQRDGKIERNEDLATSYARDPGITRMPSCGRAGFGGACASSSAPSIARFPTRTMRSRGVPQSLELLGVGSSTAKARSNSLRYARRENLYVAAFPFKRRVQPRRVEQVAADVLHQRRRAPAAPSSFPPKRELHVRSSDRRHRACGNSVAHHLRLEAARIIVGHEKDVRLGIGRALRRALAAAGASQPATSPGPLAVTAICIEDARDRIGRARPATCGASAIRPPCCSDDRALGQLVFAILIALDVNVGTNTIEQALRAFASSKPTTASTLRSASRTCRARPRTERSDAPIAFEARAPIRRRLRPTMSASPCARAQARYSTCPACSTSKQPLVKTTRAIRSARSSSRHATASATSKQLAEESSSSDCAVIHQREDLLRRRRRGTELLDDRARGEVRQLHRLFDRRAGRQAPARAPRSTVSPAPLTS